MGGAGVRRGCGTVASAQSGCPGVWCRAVGRPGAGARSDPPRGTRRGGRGRRLAVRRRRRWPTGAPDSRRGLRGHPARCRGVRRRPLRGPRHGLLRRRPWPRQAGPARRDVRPDRRGCPARDRGAAPALSGRMALRRGRGAHWGGRGVGAQLAGAYLSACSASSVDLGAWESPQDSRPAAAARSRGHFTRNFVIQATAAEWALAFLGYLRSALWHCSAQLVFFQHDEVLVHAPRERGRPQVCAAVGAGW